MDGLDDIVEEFLVESYENLAQLDADLVALEQEPDSGERLSSIFRTIHTIKGTSGFLAFPRLEEVTHHGETMLSRMREGTLALTPERTSVLLGMVDTVRSLLTSIEATGSEGSMDLSPVVAALSAAMEDVPAVAVAVPAVPGEIPAGSVAPVEVVAPAPRAAPPPAVPPVQDSDGGLPAEGAADGNNSGDTGAQARRPVADGTIRVDVDLLDRLMLLVGELVLARNQIVQTVARQTDPALLQATQRLNLVAGELQESVMKTRMQPIGHVWSQLPRVVRDLAVHFGKAVRLETQGSETELDRTLLEAVKDPLMHLVRNAVDHGIELPATRSALGKPAQGRLTLRAWHESGQVVIEIADDGAGIDPARVAATAVERGLRTAEAVARMSPAEILQLVFLPGVSTAEAVTHVSGRGVGMDVVKTNIEAIGGTIEVGSMPGEGSMFRLSIPLTLAIVPALTVECAGERYAIPQIGLQELVALTAEDAVTAVEDIGGASVYRLRGELLPLVQLSDVLGLPAEERAGHLVIAVLRAEGRRFGLLVDRVGSAEEIVVRAITAQLKAVGLYSGAAVLGDGGVALILDVRALARRALRTDIAERQEVRDAEAASIVEAEGDRMLLAAIGDGRRVAIPLAAVTRLERLRSDAVEKVGSREVVQYRGGILPIVRLDRHLGVYGSEARDALEVIVYTDRARSVAIVVDEILDIVDGESAVRSDVDDLGLLGSAVLGARVTELLDVRAAILAADPTFYANPRRTPSDGLSDAPDGAPRPLVEV